MSSVSFTFIPPVAHARVLGRTSHGKLNFTTRSRNLSTLSKPRPLFPPVRKRRAVIVSARKENNITADGDDVTVNNVTRRRFIALAEVGLELSLVAWCELNFRPKAAGDAEMNLWESILSLRPYKTPTETRNLAQAALERGQSLALAGEHAKALEQFDIALTTAPRQYMLCQAAYAGSFTSSRALSEGGGDGLQQWLWGRGTRFPGHYLLLYVFARPAFISKDQAAGDNDKRDKKAEQAAALGEVVLLFVLAGVYNYVLFTYGLDY
mmetsp:Transcript_12027/g.20333  ORF Transcript_12027/g.20333 Transcript_12027/m.20333 type:complete len:266 (-) Transcript_12027:236-1033(-)